MAAEEVKQFLESHNRPFSLTDIIQGIKGEFGKAAVQKAVDKLVSSYQVIEKVYNTQKVYFVTQKTDLSASEHKEILLEIERKITDFDIKVKDINNTIKNHTVDLEGVKGRLAEVNRRVQIQIELEQVQKELEKYEGAKAVCPKEKTKIEEDYKKNLKVYKTRKRLCLDMTDAILENYPKSKKHLYEAIGLETDEDAEFNFEKFK